MYFRYDDDVRRSYFRRISTDKRKNSVTATDDKRDGDVIIKITKPKRDCFLTRVEPK